jgi:hypothetical protein
MCENPQSAIRNPQFSAVAPVIPQESTVIENAIVRVARVQLPPRATLEGHSHLATGFCMWKCPADLSTAFCAPGGVTWLDPGNRHSVRTTSDGPYDAVIVEWK